MNRIRESEWRLIDAIDQQYGHLFDTMQTPYAYWRRYALELIEYDCRIAREYSKRDRKPARNPPPTEPRGDNR